MAGAAQPRSRGQPRAAQRLRCLRQSFDARGEIREDPGELQLDGAEVGERRAAGGVRLLAAAQGVDQLLGRVDVWLS